MGKIQKTKHKSKIGGQALIEGVMMRGIDKGAMAVRLPNGEIDLEQWELKKAPLISKIPFIRGIYNIIDSLVLGYKCLSKSAEKSGLDEEEDYEPSKFEKWLDEKLGDKLMGVVTVIGTALGAVLAIALFMFVPALLVKLLDMLIPLGGFKAVIEGLIKIGVFIGYLAAVSRIKMIKRLFEYHGAEHKTIFCYENELPLTVENVRKQSRFHPRCGTSFLFIVLILGILVFSVVTWSSVLIRTLLKLALMPVVIGISYELIKLAGRYDNFFTRIISFPGIKLQHLTTNEPDDGQIEVAIASMSAVIPENRDDDKW